MRLIGRQLLKGSHEANFGVVRIQGSHHRLRHPDGRMTVVPAHVMEAVGPSLLRKMLADCEMTRDDLQGLL